jgi:hypothetical protein
MNIGKKFYSIIIAMQYEGVGFIIKFKNYNLLNELPCGVSKADCWWWTVSS